MRAGQDRELEPDTTVGWPCAVRIAAGNGTGNCDNPAS